jgi:excinuclease UvrABC ATPase subunit
VRFPLKVFTCLTGVSGSGKSTLLSDILFRSWEEKRPEGCDRLLGRDKVDKLVLVDQAPISKCADHIIDLGPEGGEGGGWVVAESTPEEVAAAPASITGR